MLPNMLFGYKIVWKIYLDLLSFHCTLFEQFIQTIRA